MIEKEERNHETSENSPERIKAQKVHDQNYLEFNSDFFQIIPPPALLFILLNSDIKAIANLVQCSHFFSDNYLLNQRLEHVKINHLAHRELELAFDVFVRRIFTLSADFSDLDIGKQEDILLKHLPCLDFDRVSPVLLDQGRANSYVLKQRYDISIFKDLYHREALMLDKTHFCLVSLTCVLNTRHSSTKAIVFDSSLLSLVRSCLRQRGIDPDYHISNSKIPFLKDNQDPVALISVQDSTVHHVLHDLGILGALPPRDWQLKAYKAKTFPDSNAIRAWYLRIIKYLSGFEPNEATLSTPLVIPSDFKAKKNEMLAFLNDLLIYYPSDVMEEQRHFYCKIIMNLLQPIHINEAELDKQQYIQALLTLHRLEALLQGIKSYTYANFLRMIEAGIDEIIILLDLQKNNAEQSAHQVSVDIKQFIEETVGLKPQMATLRSSAMHAINAALTGCLNFFERQKQQDSKIYLYVSKAAYFEIFSTLTLLFNTTEAAVDACIRITPKDNLFLGKSVPVFTDNIYDFYMGNFESNVRSNEAELVFTNINAFIANQLLLRKRRNCPERPLIVIIDNTMSDFNEVYLPYLLQHFEPEIVRGTLGILIIHSGNKYIHLGTDKGLGALLYGYYNQGKWSCLDNEFQNELDNNKLGSFSPCDPTVLLTQAFLKYNKDDILAYSTLIRWRVANLFKNIPTALLDVDNYYIIDSPFFTIREEEARLFGRINNAGFINIRVNSKAFHGSEEKVHENILQDLLNLLTIMGIHPRDGFSFSQTTFIDIRLLEGVFPHNIRISVGTEAMELLCQKFNFLSQYLLMINKVMAPFCLTKAVDMSKNLTEHILKDILNASAGFLINQNHEHTHLLGKSRNTLFSGKNVTVPHLPETKTGKFVL